jgi:hypothetical protein
LKPLFQFFTLSFQHLAAGVGRYPNGIPEDKHAAAERTRDQKTIPGLKDFFLEALKVNGTIGNPVSIASFKTPG